MTTLVATTVTPVDEASAAEPVSAPCTASHGSCFFSIRGVLRWCKEGQRYFVSQSGHDHGYACPANRPGKWRIMIVHGTGWLRGGTITRASGGRYLVRTYRGRSLGFARGPWPVAVGAYRLVLDSGFRKPVQK